MRSLSATYPTKERRVADVSEEFPRAKLYCESRQLSVTRVGMPYPSAPYDADVPALSPSDLAG
eukprot:3597464-Lingulodinium_polyedra.AAC.1